MKRRFVLPALLLTLMVGNPAVSGDFHKGVYAYNHGNYKYALREFRSLAEQGDNRSQYNLGIMYDNGQGTQKDYVHGYMWLSVAASQGNKAARETLDKVAKLLTPTQLETARKLARECIKKNYKDCLKPNLPEK